MKTLLIILLLQLTGCCATQTWVAELPNSHFGRFGAGYRSFVNSAGQEIDKYQNMCYTCYQSSLTNDPTPTKQSIVTPEDELLIKNAM